LKNICELGRVKRYGETEIDDQKAYKVPRITVRLRECLKDFAQRDIYNFEELALQ